MFVIHNYGVAILMLVIGFVLLIKGADYFVEGASATAAKLKVPSLLIGMTIVAMGTSLPETAVSVTAGLAGSNELAIANAVGSNIFNLMVVLGMCALFVPLAIDDITLKRDLPFSVLCAIFVLAFGYHKNQLGRFDGSFLLLFFIAFLIIMISSAKKARDESTDEEINVNLPTWKCIIYILGGAIAIKFGGDFVVDASVYVAERMGISQTIIGLTVVALGTSLPELVTSLVAAKKNELDMAIGNVVGSNIFNLLMVLGIASTISPIAFIHNNVIDLVILIVFSVLVFVITKVKREINKKSGILMLALYLAYIIYICIR